MCLVLRTQRDRTMAETLANGGIAVVVSTHFSSSDPPLGTEDENGYLRLMLHPSEKVVYFRILTLSPRTPDRASPNNTSPVRYLLFGRP